MIFIIDGARDMMATLVGSYFLLPAMRGAS
jgi:hypothetical protein